MAQHGFGYWSDTILELPPDNFDYTVALRLIGYDTSDINAAIVAFKRHFIQSDVSPTLTQLDLNVLYICLPEILIAGGEPAANNRPRFF